MIEKSDEFNAVYGRLVNPSVYNVNKALLVRKNDDDDKLKQLMNPSMELANFKKKIDTLKNTEHEKNKKK